MPDTVSVMGQADRPMGGLTESLAKFRKHHAEVGDALLNLSGIGTAAGQPVDKDEPRPDYVHREYPKLIYHADGREQMAADDKELKAAQKAGFRAEPYPKVQIALGDPKAEKKALEEKIAQLEGMIRTLADKQERSDAGDKR